VTASLFFSTWRGAKLSAAADSSDGQIQIMTQFKLWFLRHLAIFFEWLLSDLNRTWSNSHLVWSLTLFDFKFWNIWEIHKSCSKVRLLQYLNLYAIAVLHMRCHNYKQNMYSHYSSVWTLLKSTLIVDWLYRVTYPIKCAKF